MNILERLPVPLETASVKMPDGSEESVNPYQIVVWISLSGKDELELDPDRPFFPAVLDTGLSHNFAIRQEHVDARTGLNLVPSGSSASIGGMVLFPKSAHVWIHRNEPGLATKSSLHPVRLRAPEGIIVYPNLFPNPSRIPTLGLRALVRNELSLIIDGKQREVTLSAG
jgi:hypothetical protein